jgi:hypothetical protein
VANALTQVADASVDRFMIDTLAPDVATIATTIRAVEESMRHVGVREFKNQATAMMSSGETLVIERHGRPVGFFVPLVAKDRQGGRAALGRLGRIVEKVLDESGLSEEDLVQGIAGTRRRR